MVIGPTDLTRWQGAQGSGTNGDSKNFWLLLYFWHDYVAVAAAVIFPPYPSTAPSHAALSMLC